MSEIELKDLPLLEQMLLLDLSIGLRTAQNLVDSYGELKVQQHALYCLWTIKQGVKIRVPAAWLTASLENEWTPPPGMPPEWEPTTLTIRIDDETFLEFIRQLREEKETT